MPGVPPLDPAIVNGVMLSNGLVKRSRSILFLNKSRSIVVLGVYGVPNGGSGSMEDLGGDGSISRYDGVVFTALGPLRQMQQQQWCTGARW
jgi:hypothetical protein